MIFSSLTGTANAKAAKGSCARCPEVQKLEGDFTAYEYAKKEDRSAGRQKMVSVLAQLERFHTAKGRNPTRGEEFRALVKLTAAAGPYDQGSEAAESLASLIVDSAELKGIFNEVAGSVSDSCRQQLLRTTVDQRLCQIEFDDRSGTLSQAEACIRRPVFNYRECVGFKVNE